MEPCVSSRWFKARSKVFADGSQVFLSWNGVDSQQVTRNEPLNNVWNEYDGSIQPRKIGISMFESMEISRTVDLIACYSNHVRCSLLAFLQANIKLAHVFRVLFVLSDVNPLSSELIAMVTGISDILTQSSRVAYRIFWTHILCNEQDDEVICDDRYMVLIMPISSHRLGTVTMWCSHSHSM